MAWFDPLKNSGGVPFDFFDFTYLSIPPSHSLKNARPCYFKLVFLIFLLYIYASPTFLNVVNYGYVLLFGSNFPSVLLLQGLTSD